MFNIENKKSPRSPRREPLLVDDTVVDFFRRRKGEFLNALSADPNHPLDVAWGQTAVARRTVAKVIGVGAGAVGATVLLGDQLMRLATGEFEGSQNSTLWFGPEQQERLEGAESMCLFFGGASVEEPQKLGFADALTPALQKLGPVGYINYAKTGVKAEDIAEAIKEKQEQYGIKNVSLYLDSAGLQAAGDALAILGDDITVTHAFLDSNPTTVQTTRFPDADILFHTLDALGYDGGFILMAYTNDRAYHDAFKDGAAHAGLGWDQGRIVAEGPIHVRKFADKAMHDKTKLAFLRVGDVTTDGVVDPIGSEKSLRDDFGLDKAMITRLLGGNQAHANYPFNAAEYQRVINDVITYWEEEEKITAKI